MNELNTKNAVKIALADKSEELLVWVSGNPDWYSTLYIDGDSAGPTPMVKPWRTIEWMVEVLPNEYDHLWEGSRCIREGEWHEVRMDVSRGLFLWAFMYE